MTGSGGRGVEAQAGSAPPSARDRQRAKVYEAENLVHRIFDRSVDFPEVDIAGSRLTIPVERRFATIESAQAYVDAVLASPAVRARWPRAEVPVFLRERRGQHQADYQRLTSVMAVPAKRTSTGAGASRVSRGQPGCGPGPSTGGGGPWALRELVILHELTHHLAEDDEEAHGPEFTARLIALSGHVIGEEAGFLLRTTMWDNGVRVG